MRKTLAIFLCLILVIAVAATACGGTEKDTESKTEAKTEARTEAKTEAQTEAQTESKTDAQTEGQTEAQTESKTDAQTEGQTEAQTEAQSEQQTENTETLPANVTVPALEEGKISFVTWDEEGYSPIYVIPESMYNTLEYYDTDTVDGITWNVTDTYTVYLEFVEGDGNEYNYGMTWEGFVSSQGPGFFGIDDAALGLYTAKVDLDGNGTEEYCAMFRYVGFFADPTVGGWQDQYLAINWDTADGGSGTVECDFIVTNPDFY